MDPQEASILGVDPKKIVTEEQFNARKAAMLDNLSDHVLLLETPAADVKAMEELLGVEEGKLPNFVCRFKKGTESCANCGRHSSILDMAKTGLKFHSKDFILDTIFGRHGGIVWNDVLQTPECYDCGLKIAQFGYICQVYGCGGGRF